MSPKNIQLCVTWPASLLVTDKPLPGDLFLCIRHRMVKYRNEGDSFTADEYDKLIYNRVQYVFVTQEKLPKFEEWSASLESNEREFINAAKDEQKEVLQEEANLRETTLNLFQNPTNDEHVKTAIKVSKSIVSEFLKKPYVIDRISMMQKFGHGCVDHSVNVAMLSAFLGLRLGYASQTILEDLTMGGLLHDIGKAFLPQEGDKLLDETSPEYRQHPIHGKNALLELKMMEYGIRDEVLMIVEQHHEFADGSGYPNGTQGLSIYELTRVVSIANIFDNLVTKAKGDIRSRHLQALETLEKDYSNKLDKKKLEKAISVIKFCIG